MNRNEIKAKFIDEFKGPVGFRHQSMKEKLFSFALSDMHAYYHSIGDPDYQGRENDIYR